MYVYISIHMPNIFLFSRFGTNFLMLQRLLLVKSGLQQMVVSTQWKDWVRPMSASEKVVAADIEDQVLDNTTFWASVNEVCTVMQPAFLLLRQLEGDEPNAGAVYAAAAAVQDMLQETAEGMVLGKQDLKDIRAEFLRR